MGDAATVRAVLCCNTRKFNFAYARYSRDVREGARVRVVCLFAFRSHIYCVLHGNTKGRRMICYFGWWTLPNMLFLLSFL